MMLTTEGNCTPQKQQRHEASNMEHGGHGEESPQLTHKIVGNPKLL